MRLIRLLLLALCVYSCSCSSDSSRHTLRIGVDTKWYPLDFGPQTSYVNGFTEDLLLEMARYSGMQFEIVYANWDSLMDGLKEQKYDAVLSSLPPYEYNKAKYDFSENFLDLGPVLITKVDGKWDGLKELGGELVGIIANDPSETLIAKHPTIIIRSYNGVPELLNAVVNGEIEGAVLNRIPAVNFVGDLYASSLKIIGTPMTEEGLHLVAVKGKGHSFSQHLESIKKKKSFETLLKKWSL